MERPRGPPAHAAEEKAGAHLLSDPTAASLPCSHRGRHILRRPPQQTPHLRQSGEWVATGDRDQPEGSCSRDETNVLLGITCLWSQLCTWDAPTGKHHHAFGKPPPPSAPEFWGSSAVFFWARPMRQPSPLEQHARASSRPRLPWQGHGALVLWSRVGHWRCRRAMPNATLKRNSVESGRFPPEWQKEKFWKVGMKSDFRCGLSLFGHTSSGGRTGA